MKEIEIIKFVNSINSFKCNQEHLKVLEYIDTFKKSVVISARGIGKTSISLLYALFYALTNENSDVFIIGCNARSPIYFRHRLASFVIDLGIELRENNRSCIGFKNKSNIRFRPASMNTLRGSRPDVIILDEFDFLDKKLANDIYFQTAICSTYGLKKLLVNSTLSELDESPFKNIIHLSNTVDYMKYKKMFNEPIDENKFVCLQLG